MINRSKPYTGLGDFFVTRRKRKPDFFDAVDRAISWEPINKFLSTKLNRKANVVGNPAYPALLMFKILLLQKWYKLSDPAMEEMLINHLGFLRFVGLSVEQDVPDETTICRFRNGLVSLGILEKINEMVLAQLEQAGVLVREGAIVDATVVESACRPRKTVEVMPEDRKEDDLSENTTAQSVTISYSKDKDAAWLKKGKKFYYGYKHHLAVDDEHGFFLGGHTTPANKSDIGEFEKLVNTIELPEDGTVFADKGYTSANNRKILKEKKLNSGIMNKASKNKKLTEIEEFVNRQISKFRYKVERSCGNLKQHFDLRRSRYIGIAKVETELLIIGIAFNIKKATKFVAQTG